MRQRKFNGRRKFDDSKFDEYSMESCYWAGFLAADGYIKDNRLSISLAAKDENHLELFKEFMESSNTITTLKNGAKQINLHSWEMTSKLENNWNIVNKKSLIYEYPPQMPEQYFWSFMRGYFDGDGTWCESFSNKNSRTASFYARVLGSPKFMEVISNKIFYYLQKTPIKLQTHPNGVNLALKLNTNDAITFGSWLYSGSTENNRLERKYAIYEKVAIVGSRLVR